MSKDHAIMLLDVVIRITDNWEVHQEAGNSPLNQVCNLLREAKGNLEVAPVQVVDDEKAIVGLMGDRGIRGLATNNIGREDAEAVLRDIRAGRVPGICAAAPVPVVGADLVVTDHAGASFTGSLSHSVQVTDDMVHRFLERLRDLAGNGYVSSYGDAAHAIDGIWLTEELRAALLAALGEK